MRIILMAMFIFINITMTAQNLDIYYFSLVDHNLNNRQIYESEKLLKCEERWTIVKNDDGIEEIQTIVGLNIFDYHLLKQVNINESELPNFDNIIKVQDFASLIQLVEDSLFTSVSIDEYYYRIFIPKVGHHYNPYPFKFDNERLKISTIHSTYLTTSKNQDKIEVFSYDTDSTKEWLDINTANLMSYGNIKFRIDKVFYRDEFLKMLMELKALYRIAISTEKKIINVNYH